MHATRPTPSPSRLRPLLARRFRANPSYRLIAHDHLDARQRALFADVSNRRDHYGLLVPTDVVQAGVKAIDVDLADLLRRLSQPAHLPNTLTRAADARLHARLASLVLDGILEVELDGTLVSGPNAASRLAPHDLLRPPTDHIAAISRDAMRLAHYLPTDDPVRVSSWLYHYNTMPLGPAWARRLALTSVSVVAQSNAANQSVLTDRYESTLHAAWQSWSRRAPRASGDDRHLAYKLYVSPHPRALREVFDRVVSVLLEADVAAFKLGRGPAGLLRPDKLVVYLADWDELSALARTLRTALADLPAQGVPFTAACSDDGMLSWGMDPPPQTRGASAGPAESWRLWITNRVARALLHARAHGADADASRVYAVTRLALEGVDAESWIPGDEVFALDALPASAEVDS